MYKAVKDFKWAHKGIIIKEHSAGEDVSATDREIEDMLSSGFIEPEIMPELEPEKRTKKKKTSKKKK